tara:strand:+ start:1551 stop:1736 length:186 start_codon:yes stop_codon:yes gene_type:complete
MNIIPIFLEKGGAIKVVASIIYVYPDRYSEYGNMASINHGNESVDCYTYAFECLVKIGKSR